MLYVLACVRHCAQPGAGCSVVDMELTQVGAAGLGVLRLPLDFRIVAHGWGAPPALPVLQSVQWCSEEVAQPPGSGGTAEMGADSGALQSR